MRNRQLLQYIYPYKTSYRCTSWGATRDFHSLSVVIPLCLFMTIPRDSATNFHLNINISCRLLLVSSDGDTSIQCCNSDANECAFSTEHTLYQVSFGKVCRLPPTLTFFLGCLPTLRNTWVLWNMRNVALHRGSTQDV